MARKAVGDKINRETSNSDGSLIRYVARVVIADEKTYWIEIPKKVRSLPFPPFGGKRYVQFSQLEYIGKL